MQMIDPMHASDPSLERQLRLTRRRFFSQAAKTAASGVGAAALASLFGPTLAGAKDLGFPELRGPHHKARAKRVIYLHMEGAPSQLDLFDYKPQLRERYDEDLP